MNRARQTRAHRLALDVIALVLLSMATGLATSVAYGIPWPLNGRVAP